ncbi:MAG: HAMP domain-containing protein [Chitinophagaceae bacterium]|nr:HAMP domain-containing protein [Chitinophagaceae bacterium]
MKVRYKITLAFIFLTTILLLSLCFFTYYNTAQQQERDFNKMLNNRAHTISSLLLSSKFYDYKFLSEVDSATRNLLFAENINVFNVRNERVYHFARNASDTINIPVQLIQQARIEKKIIQTVGNKKTLAIYNSDPDYPIVVIVSANDENGRQKLSALKHNLTYGFLVGVLLSFIFGWFFSNSILRPLIQINNRVDKISASNFEERLPVKHLKDEWNKLAQTFNSLLSRLRESFELQGRFIANASHELSTPLTSVSNQIDVVLRKERSKEEYLHVLRSVKTDVQHMSALTQQLLDIARTSSGGAIQTENLRVDELLMELPAMMKKIDSTYAVSVFFDELPDEESYCLVNGNYALLLAAFKNITENGCKYSPNQHVKISLSFIENKIVILFSNLSTILDSAEIENIFQPFQRGSNATNIKGYGLGLSLTRRIILLHKGEVKAELSKDQNIMISVILKSVLLK